MKNHYIAVADQGHLRIYRVTTGPMQTTPGLAEVQSLDFPQGKMSYVESDTDMAGRFQSSKHQGAAAGAPAARSGMSIDERLPMQREVDRRRIDDVAHAIEEFLAADTTATWDFAAGPTSHNAILEQLSPQLRARLRKSVSKDLVNQPRTELLGHF